MIVKHGIMHFRAHDKTSSSKHEEKSSEASSSSFHWNVKGQEYPGIISCLSPKTLLASISHIDKGVDWKSKVRFSC